MTPAGGDWSLVTVTHNSAATLRECWAAAEVGAAEWVVVDNASSDDSVEVARALGARVVPLARNLGFGAANNIGLTAVRRPWVAFVNPDVRIDEPDGLARLAALSRAHGALVAPQLLNPDGTEQPNARGLPYLASKLAHRGLPIPGAETRDYARTGLTGPTYVAWSIGAAVAAPTEVFRRLGGWDERFFIYYEDHDLGLRAWAAGVPVLVDPQVRWMHQWQRATTRPDPKAWRHEARSAVRFYRRYPHLLVRRSGGRGLPADCVRLVWTSAPEPD